MRNFTVSHWSHVTCQSVGRLLTASLSHCELNGGLVRRVSLLVMVVVMIAVAFPVAAAECGGNLNQHELNECFDRVYRRADAELNAVYRHLAGNLGASDEGKAYVGLLQAAERAWVTFRDQECEFETAVTRGGSIHPMEVSICLTRLTRERSKELKRQLSCPEGDLGCVR